MIDRMDRAEVNFPPWIGLLGRAGTGGKISVIGAIDGHGRAGAGSVGARLLRGAGPCDVFARGEYLNFRDRDEATVSFCGFDPHKASGHF